MARWSIVFIWTAATVLSESKRLRDDNFLKETRKTSTQEATPTGGHAVERANETPHFGSPKSPRVSRNLLKFQRSAGTWHLGVVHRSLSHVVHVIHYDDEQGLMFRPVDAYQNVRVGDRIYLLDRADAWVEGRVTELNDKDEIVTVSYQTSAGPERTLKVTYDYAIVKFLLELPLPEIQKALPEDSPPVSLRLNMTAADFCDTSGWTCSVEHRWSRSEYLNKGTYGQVWAVSSKEVALSAIKYPVSLKSVPGGVDPDDCEDNRKEVEKMKQLKSAVGALQGCEHSFMQLVDEFPCLNSDHPRGLFVPVTGYVMDHMSGTIKTWYKSERTKKLSVHQLQNCKDKITEMVYSALKCFHDGNWVHADFKVGNVLFLGYGSDGCPEQVRLADFGLSGEIGSESTELWSYETYEDVGYLPMDMFEMPTDPFPYPLGLARTRTWLDSHGRSEDEPHFIRQPALDWCSFAFEWKEHLQVDVCTLPGDWDGDLDCGPMGHDRDASNEPSNRRRLIVRPCAVIDD